MDELKCNACGERYYYFKDYVYCPLCGEKFAQSSVNNRTSSTPPMAHPTVNNTPVMKNITSFENASPKSKTTAILLCLLGVIGLCGIHRFYVGKTGSGLVNLFTFGMCWIWALVDFILLITGNFTDNKGLKLK